MTFEESINKNKKMLKIVAVIFVAISFIFLIYFKITNPEIELRNIFIFGSIFLLIGVGIFFLTNIMHSFSKNKEESVVENANTLPKAASIDEMVAIANDIMKKPFQEGGFENHIKRIETRRVETRGGNTVAYFKIIPLYIDDDKSVFDFFYNAHYPKNVTIRFGLNEGQINSVLNRKSKRPEDRPDTEETVRLDPMSGQEVRHRKISYKDHNIQDKSEDKSET